MDSKFFLILVIALLSQNAQALVAKDSLDEDVTFELQRGEQPWLAMLQLPGGVTCSGSIVSPTSLLSAAVCLQGATHPAHGVAYAGNVKYTVPEDFDPPTQNRSVVDYVLYNENNTLEYNIVLVKITPKWIWSILVQPVGVIDVERLPQNLTSSCFVSGLGAGSDNGSTRVARSASVYFATCARSPQPQEHRMCSVDSGMIAPRAGDMGGPVLCEDMQEDKLYGIISEHGQSISEELQDPDKFPSHISAFQFVGIYRSWINITAGDLPRDSEVKSLRMQQEDIPLPLEMKRLYRAARRWNREPSSSTDGGAAGGSEETGGAADGDGAGGDGAAGGGNNTVGSGAGRVCFGASALLAALLALAVRALY